MKLLLIWVTMLPEHPVATLHQLMYTKPKYKKDFYMYHDGIGHQWTDDITRAREFNNQEEVDEIIEQLDRYNYEGTFGSEQSIAEILSELDMI